MLWVARRALLATHLNQVFQSAFAAAKRVRSETAIGQNPVSVAYASVSLAEQIFADLKQVHALLIGAGETIELVARHLRDKKLDRLRSPTELSVVPRSWPKIFPPMRFYYRIFMIICLRRIS